MQTFYSAKSIKEGLFSKRRTGGVANKDTMFLIGESGRLNFKFLVDELKGEGICTKWLDQLCRQLCKNTQRCNNSHLISHNKYLEYILLKERAKW